MKEIKVATTDFPFTQKREREKMAEKIEKQKEENIDGAKTFEVYK